MEKNILSKSTYIKGNQCLKYLFLYKKFPKLRDNIPQERMAKFKRGTDVGVYAQQIFPGGIDCSPKSPSQYQKMIEFTAAQIETGTNVLYEALFQFNKTLVIIDILVKDELGKYHAYEVKSSLKLSETYYEDASLQYFVIKNSLPDLESISLIYLNQDYVLEDTIEIAELFKIENITNSAKDRWNAIENKINAQLLALENEEIPNLSIGQHCFLPYDCEFIGYCWQNIKSPNYFDVPILTFDEKENLFKTKSFDLQSFREVFSQNPIALRQAQSLFYNRPTLQKDYSTEYPVFIKFLFMKPAIPLFRKSKPYQSRMYGFSALKNENGKNTEITELSENQDELISKLKNWISKNERLICYESNTEFLREHFSDYLIFNLLEDLKNGDYYHPAIKSDVDFASVFQAFTGSKIWFAKINNEQYAAILYEEYLINDKSQNQFVENLNNIRIYVKNFVLGLQKLHYKLNE